MNVPGKDEIPAKDMPTCPALGCDGKMVQRRSRFGKPFFSCSTFPDCDVIINNLDDLNEKYPDHPKTPYVKKPKKGKFGAKKRKEALEEKRKRKNRPRNSPPKTLKELQEMLEPKNYLVPK